MINALRSAATGMNAQQTLIDGLANDLANINTSAYKKSRAAFEDLYYDQIKAPGATNAQNLKSPNGIQVGHGTKLTAIYKDFTTGDLKQTDQALDLAIEGNGFFILTNAEGEKVYSRDGVMQLDDQGNIVNGNGLKLDPALTVPINTTSITISKDGIVSIKTSDSAEIQELGQISLAMFQNPAGLEYAGGNLYKETGASGTAATVLPGVEGSGKISQGFVEGSNVNVGESLISMVVAQRSYESNAKVIETADRMMQSVNNIL